MDSALLHPIHIGLASKLTSRCSTSYCYPVPFTVSYCYLRAISVTPIHLLVIVIPLPVTVVVCLNLYHFCYCKSLLFSFCVESLESCICIVALLVDPDPGRGPVTDPSQNLGWASHRPGD